MYDRFFTGVVEDRQDPLEQGRVRVRVHYLHPRINTRAENNGLATEDLLWMSVLSPTTSAAMSGIGETPLGPVEGTNVFGLWIDEFNQSGLVIGTIAGTYTEAPDYNFGFCDPKKKYPLYVGNDVNELARPVPDTVPAEVQAQNDTLDTAPAYNGEDAFKEPESPYAARYPFNHVTQSESGHITQVDDTEGAERTYQKHRSGTMEEVHPDGTRVQRIVGDDYQIVKSGRKVHIIGDLDVVVGGNTRVYVQGDAELWVNGNVKETVDGNVTQLVKGSITQTVEGDVTQVVKGNTDSTIHGNATQLIKGDVSETVEGDAETTIHKNMTATVHQNASIKVDGSVDQTVDGDYTLTIGGDYNTVIGGQRQDNVVGNWTRNSALTTDKATGQFIVDGSVILLG